MSVADACFRVTWSHDVVRRELLPKSDALPKPDPCCAPEGAGLKPPRELASPAAAADRIDAIDVVRGAALFGVLTVNLLMAFRVSIFAQFIAGLPPQGLEAWVENAVESALELKAFALFSLLFGVGLAMQFERLQSSGRPFHFLSRRILALLGFGLLHLVFIWNGDILTEYAIAALCVLPWMHARRWVLAVSSAAFLLLYAEAPLMPQVFVWPGDSQLVTAVDVAQRVYPTCTLADCWQQNVRELPLILPLHVFIFPRTLGLILLGVWSWRSGAIRQMENRRGCLLVVATVCLATSAWLTHLANVRAFVDTPWLADLVAGIGPVGLAVGYGAAIAWLALRYAGAAWLVPLACIGRMAFSNYIAQSLIFTAIFFGFGLGLFGRVGAAPAFALGIAVYVLQAASSTLWLRHFQYGPLEWVWRVLMYGRLQPFRRRA